MRLEYLVLVFEETRRSHDLLASLPCPLKNLDHRPFPVWVPEQMMIDDEGSHACRLYHGADITDRSAEIVKAEPVPDQVRERAIKIQNIGIFGQDELHMLGKAGALYV